MQNGLNHKEKKEISYKVTSVMGAILSDIDLEKSKALLRNFNIEVHLFFDNNIVIKINEF